MMHRRDNFSFQKKSLILILIVGVGVFFLSYSPARSMLSQKIYIVAPNIWAIESPISETWESFIVNFRIKRSLVHENEVLRAEINRMQAQVLDRNLLEERLRLLESMLGRESADNRILANVLINNKQSLYDTLIIDVGLDHNVSVGDLVMYAGAGVIGEIIEVFNSSAKVMIYSSPGKEWSVRIGEASVPAVAHGRGMGNFEAKIPQGSVVRAGDYVLVPQGNFILGSVFLVEENPIEPFAKVFFRMPFNITEIRTVEVMIGEQS